MSRKDPMPIGELPPLGKVPQRMLAHVIRQKRLGDPRKAFKIEEVNVPELRPGEVLIGVMAAGINYNNVWAARGKPIDVITVRQKAGDPHDFHIGGSDASGVVYALGSGVADLKIGDEVVVYPGHWDNKDPWVKAGRDPMLAPTARIWGYDTNFGSFAQFAVAQAYQCLPKAAHLTWEEAAAPNLVGATAYRMLHGWPPNNIQENDLLLVWGGSGGVGAQAIQLSVAGGGRPIAVVSDSKRGEYCLRLGAIGYINRREFDHWGLPPHWTDGQGQRAWLQGVRGFGKKIWEIAGERTSPQIVFEHPGEATIPTSIFVCAPGGMVVICAGTTGFTAAVDLRFHWVHQKRLQGSHGANIEQAQGFNDLIHRGVIDPTLGKLYSFDDIPQAHYEMEQGLEVFGNRVALIGAVTPNLGRK